MNDLSSPLFHSTPDKINFTNNTSLNFSITKTSDSSYLIMPYEKLVSFRVIEKKESNKRQMSSSVISNQATKRGKYLNACPEVQELHQNAADKEKNKKKIKKQNLLIKNGCTSDLGKSKLIITNK